MPHLNGILHRWKDWRGDEEVQNWIKNIITNDKNLILLLEQFLSHTISYSSTRTKVQPRLDPEWLKPFLNIEEAIERIKKLSTNKKLTEKQKTALNQLLKEYEMRQQGKDPSGFFAFDKD